jgi:hypothetical protein
MGLSYWLQGVSSNICSTCRRTRLALLTLSAAYAKTVSGDCLNEYSRKRSEIEQVFEIVSGFR